MICPNAFVLAYINHAEKMILNLIALALRGKLAIDISMRLDLAANRLKMLLEKPWINSIQSNQRDIGTITPTANKTLPF